MKIISFTTTKLLNVIDTYWERSRWVILFLIICFYGFEQGQKSIHRDYTFLAEKLVTLKTEYKKASVLEQDLQLRINSQSDPEWIELTLIKELGLVPEGQTKIVINEYK